MKRTSTSSNKASILNFIIENRNTYPILFNRLNDAKLINAIMRSGTLHDNLKEGNMDSVKARLEAYERAETVEIYNKIKESDNEVSLENLISKLDEAGLIRAVNLSDEAKKNIIDNVKGYVNFDLGNSPVKKIKQIRNLQKNNIEDNNKEDMPVKKSKDKEPMPKSSFDIDPVRRPESFKTLMGSEKDFGKPSQTANSENGSGAGASSLPSSVVTPNVIADIVDASSAPGSVSVAENREAQESINNNQPLPPNSGSEIGQVDTSHAVAPPPPQINATVSVTSPEQAWLTSEPMRPSLQTDAMRPMFSRLGDRVSADLTGMRTGPGPVRRTIADMMNAGVQTYSDIKPTYVPASYRNLNDGTIQKTNAGTVSGIADDLKTILQIDYGTPEGMQYLKGLQDYRLALENELRVMKEQLLPLAYDRLVEKGYQEMTERMGPNKEYNMQTENKKMAEIMKQQFYSRAR